MAWYAPWKILSWHQWSNEYEVVRRAESMGRCFYRAQLFFWVLPY
ncbi:Type IV secretion system protein VirD4 [Desulfovibrio sp. DV]|nr:Type IV secretion system protein VirD4 [Desulfovibrio sp. DV]